MSGFLDATRNALASKARNWSIVIFLASLVPAALFWREGVSPIFCLTIGFASALSMLASSINSAWYGGKLNPSTGFMDPPTHHSWGYILVEWAITLIFLVSIFPQMFDHFTTYALLASTVISNFLIPVWRYRDQIFTKTALD